MTFVPKGIIPPIITPLTDEGEVNYPVLRQMVNHLIDLHKQMRTSSALFHRLWEISSTEMLLQVCS